MQQKTILGISVHLTSLSLISPNRLAYYLTDIEEFFFYRG
jgi:hypothetical protein